MTPRIIRRVLSCAVLSLVLLASCAAVTPPAVTIDGTRITDDQLAHEEDLFSFLSGLSRSSCGQRVSGETQTAACARFVLSNVIQEHFVLAYAAEHHISITDADVKQTIDRLDTQVGSKIVDEELKSHRLTRQDLSDLARRILLFSKVQEIVTEEQVSEAGLRAQYQQQILQFTIVQVEHILVKTKDEAERVYRQVTAAGATEQTFLDLAKKVSIDPSAKQNSGSLGSAVASTYVQPFGRVAASLEPGQISRPVHTQFGWHVIRLVTKQVTPFSQAKKKLVQQQDITVFNAWLRDRIADSELSVNPKYGRFDEQSLSVEPIRSTTGAGPSTSESPAASVPAPTPSPST